MPLVNTSLKAIQITDWCQNEVSTFDNAEMRVRVSSMVRNHFNLNFPKLHGVALIVYLNCLAFLNSLLSYFSLLLSVSAVRFINI